MSYTHTQCFEHFGITPTNTQWSWSGRRDGLVVYTFMAHCFADFGKYAQQFSASDRKRHGYRELVRNIEYALERCRGELSVIMAIPKDRNAEPIKIRECWPVDWKMKITYFNKDTGELRAERIA
jgi:hypothetical protein